MTITVQIQEKYEHFCRNHILQLTGYTESRQIIVLRAAVFLTLLLYYASWCDMNIHDHLFCLQKDTTVQVLEIHTLQIPVSFECSQKYRLITQTGKLENNKV